MGTIHLFISDLSIAFLYFSNDWWFWSVIVILILFSRLNCAKLINFSRDLSSSVHFFTLTFSPLLFLSLFSWFAFLSCLSISFSKLFFMMLLWPLHGLNNLISTNLFRDTKIYSFCVVMVSIIHSSCMLSFIHIYTKTQASKSTCSKFVFLECPQFVVNCTPCLFPSFWNPVLIDKPSSKVRVYYIHHLYSYSCIYPMQSRRLILLPSSIL